MGTEAKGRDENGRFVKGHKVNLKSERDKNSRDIFYRAFRDAVTPKQWTLATKKMLTLVMDDGDTRAYKMLADYLMGRPIQMLEAQIDLRGQIDDRDREILDRVYENVSDCTESGSSEEPT